MLMLALAMHLAVQASPRDTLPDSADPPAVDTVAVSPDRLADAYLDADARRLVLRARERLSYTDHSITEYRTLAKERISVGVRALRRDRMLYRREIAADILWRRDGVGHVRVLGARQAIPIAKPDPEVPDGVAGDAADLVFNPRKDLLISHLGSGDGIRNPLAVGSEADYRFATGDTTRIRLAGDREIRLIELRVVPRRAHGLLLRGSLWLDMDSYAAVRGVFRLAAPLDIGRDLGESDEIPRLLQPMEVDLRYLTVDYGLWEDRWWMPRLIALEGEARVGDLGRVPVRFERSYEDYQVRGGRMLPLRVADLDSPPGAEESVPRNTCRKADEGEEEVEGEPESRREWCWSYHVTTPADSVLLAGPDLPPSIYDPESLIPEAEIRELAAALRRAVPGGRPWHAPVVRVEYLQPGLVRYNRVQGLALGAEVSADLGAARVDATGWLGTADLRPNAEIRVERTSFATVRGGSVYRRLEAVEPGPRDPGFGRSVAALLLGRDDDDYYRTLGAELTGRSLDSGRASYGWRLFAERQGAAGKHTDFSVPRLFDPDRGFRENIVADAADQVGLEITGRLAGGSDPRAFRWRLSGSLLGEAGDFALARPGATGSVGFPLPLGAVAAVEVAAGTMLGDVTTQRLWYLGGPATVRGYGGDSRVSGESFWRGRLEIGSTFPGARIVVFSDAGWAGARGAWELDPPLLSAGIGASFLDGLIRVDLARAMRSNTGWRIDLHTDAIL